MFLVDGAYKCSKRTRWGRVWRFWPTKSRPRFRTVRGQSIS